MQRKTSIHFAAKKEMYRETIVQLSGESWKICIWFMNCVDWFYQQNVKSFLDNMRFLRCQEKGNWITGVLPGRLNTASNKSCILQ